MSDREKVDAYIGRRPEWTATLEAARKILLDAGLTETVKWGAPAYMLDGRNVAGLAGFKNHCALWFHQGVFLEDPAKKLVNAQPGVTRGLRQWRFARGERPDLRLVRAYVLEAVANQRADKAVRPAKGKAPAPPAELEQALAADARLKAAFEGLTPGRRREYAEHIGGAERERTRRARLERARPMILAGEGLHDRYRRRGA